MSLKHNIEARVKEILDENWSSREEPFVPLTSSLLLRNDAVTIDGVVLCADISGSTWLVNSRPHTFAAEMYKIFVQTVVKVIRSEGGKAIVCEGDRVMGVFVGDSKNTAAVSASMKVNYARNQIINPAIKERYNDESYQLLYRIGIDSSELFATRGGMKVTHDIIWVGPAVNNAAKLCRLSSRFSTRVTEDVYLYLSSNLAHGGGLARWEKTYWYEGDKTIYRSNSELELS